MFNWLRELYEIRRDNKVCETCNVLKMENARLLAENSKLIDRILEKPVEKVIETTENFKPILPRNTSWNIKRQMLEAEDRKKAQIIKQQNESMKESTEDLERELNIVEKEREANGH